VTFNLTPHEAFRSAILEAPDDDAVRLIYGDFLQDQGDPRGEFIQAQCRLAQLELHDPDRPSLQVREQQLLNAHRAEWERPCRGIGSRALFHRGFIEGLTMDAAVFLHRATELFRLTPLRQLRLQRAAGLGEALAACPDLARLTHLDLSANALSEVEIKALADSPFLTNLRRLTLIGADLDDVGFGALVRSPHLGRLMELDVRLNHVGPEGVRGVGEESRLSSLTSLSLFGNRLGSQGGVELAASSGLPGLQHLNLGRNRIGSPGAQALAGAAFLGGVKTLNLCDNEVRDDGALRLTDDAALDGLSRLVLRGNLLTAEVRRRLQRRFGERIVF
jgi:uncharacterized protein (TIGR02996 family)